MPGFLEEAWEAGGWVLIPIILVGTWGYFLILQTMIELGKGLRRRDLRAGFQALGKPLIEGDARAVEAATAGWPGVSRCAVKVLLENRGLAERGMRGVLGEKLARELHKLERHVPLIRVMAAAAPLLGLMGTVSGLIRTFSVMSKYGNSNPGLLAGGISEALIATQFGLLLAITLILTGHQLEGRVRWVKSQTEYGMTFLLNQLYNPKARGT